MQRKNSYIIINIEEMENTINEKQITINEKQIIIEAIKKINKDQSLFQILLYLNYYLFSCYIKFVFYFLPKNNLFLFSKNFKVQTIILDNNKTLYKSSCTNDLILYDNGMIVNNLFIPYENIIEFGSNDGVLYLRLFAKLNKIEDVFYFSLGNDILTIFIETNLLIKIKIL